MLDPDDDDDDYSAFLGKGGGGVSLALSARCDGGRSAFGARWLPATGVDLGLSAGVVPPRRFMMELRVLSINHPCQPPTLMEHAK